MDRYKYSTRYDPAQKVKHRDAGAAILHQLEARLAKAPFLLGQKPSLADIAIFPFVRQFRIAEPNWFDEAPISQVRRWQEGWTGCPLFAQAMEKFPIWAETGHEQLFSVGPELRPENDLMPIFHN